jgi:hypothetical protein
MVGVIRGLRAGHSFLLYYLFIPIPEASVDRYRKGGGDISLAKSRAVVAELVAGQV